MHSRRLMVRRYSSAYQRPTSILSYYTATTSVFAVVLFYCLWILLDVFFFFFNDRPPPEFSPLPLPAALPISSPPGDRGGPWARRGWRFRGASTSPLPAPGAGAPRVKMRPPAGRPRRSGPPAPAPR